MSDKQLAAVLVVFQTVTVAGFLYGIVTSVLEEDLASAFAYLVGLVGFSIPVYTGLTLAGRMRGDA